MDDLQPCVYCGLPADSVDHIPPRHMRAQLPEIELQSIIWHEVPACRECNSALGARPLLTLSERRDYAKGHISRKYKKYLALPDRTPAELEEYGPNLRGLILSNMAIKETAKARLRW